MLLPDEPFGGLDESRRREALALVCEVNRRYNIPIVIVSHLTEEVIALADYVVRLEQGRMSEAGPSGTLSRNIHPLRSPHAIVFPHGYLL